MSDKTLTVLVSHQRPLEVADTIARWQRVTHPEMLLLAYGGTSSDFAGVTHQPSLFIDDFRLRTQDHQRQYQSWSNLIGLVSQWLRHEPSVSYIYLVEYDQIPLAHDLHARLVALAKTEKADLLAHHLHRVDDTSHPHFLYHASDPRFMEFWRNISLRENRSCVLSMFGSGSFWRREAFLAVAEREEPFPMYLEIYLPTLAHHLGYRVRDFGEQNRFVHNLGDRSAAIDQANREGAWTLHPVKKLLSHNLE